MPNIAALTKANAARFAAAKMTRFHDFASVVLRLTAAKERYLTISARTGVPWFVIAVIHEREASQRWDRSIAQGDPWVKKSTHVPAGRGPFKSFEDAAYDALVNCAPYAARWRDWSAGGALTLLEQYNGLGYANKGVPSPYVWSGTDQYRSGKYIRDHVYDPNVVDSQLGCAGLILAMQSIDASIQFGAQGSIVVQSVKNSGQAVVPPHPATVPSVPSIAHPAAGSIGGWIASFFRKAA